MPNFTRAASARQDNCGRSPAEVGIFVRSPRPGENRAGCPACAQVKARPGDDALAVKIEPDGWTACCHRCGWSATSRLRQEDHRRPRAMPRSVAIEPDAAAERRQELVRDIWRHAQPISPLFELPWLYLTKLRGLRRWHPERLLWHPACPWGSGTTGCIIAPINAARGGLVVGVWRIKPSLEGKAERRGLGPTKGNAARLFHPPGSQVVIAEGVEDALAAHELTSLPAWAALSAGNMADLVLPQHLLEVLILADRDDNGLGQERAHLLAARLRREGRHAEVRSPTTGKDANDVLRRAG